MHRLTVSCSLCLGILATSGCGGENAQLVARHRSQLLLAEEPDGAQHVSDLREALLSPPASTENENSAEQVEQDDPVPQADDAVASAGQPQDIVLVGIVGGVTNPFQETQPEFPFAKGEAQFFLADVGVVAEAESDGHRHAPGEECAFCAAHAEDNAKMLAVVRFTDENGEVLPVDARDLFDLKGKETVVVRGAARRGVGDTVILDARGLYVRR